MSLRIESLCFGGPLNEQRIWHDRDIVLAPVPERAGYNYRLSEALKPSVDSTFRTVTYRREQIAWHGHVWTVLVAEGYPKQRITDAMNAIAALCRLRWVWR